MRFRQAGARAASAALILTAISAQPAAAESGVAYIDPGTGSLITQVFLGGVAGAAVVAKVGWRRLIRRGAANADEQATSTDDEVEPST